MQSVITIRKAHINDAGAIATILRNLGWFEHINKETPASTEQHVAEQLALAVREEHNAVLVAEENGVVVGYTAVHWFPNLMRGGVDGYVSELFVLPGATGKGVGSQLLAAIKELAIKRGCTRLLLMNRRSRESYRRQFYVKHGWVELPDGAYFSLALQHEHSKVSGTHHL